MLKNIFTKIKIFFYGLITGIITAIMGYLYIKNQKVIKKIIKIKRGKNESNSDLQSRNQRQRFERNENKEWGYIRQSNRSLGRRKINLERGLQCGQLEQPEQDIQNRDSERELLGNNGLAQGKIQSDTINKPMPQPKRLDKTDRNRKNLVDNPSKSEMEQGNRKIHKHP